LLKRVKYGTLGDKKSRALGLLDLWTGCATAPLEAAFQRLMVEASGRYRAELRRRHVVDFAELPERVRDTWRDSPDAREDAQRRVSALLVDEFQDTNRVQLELVTLLSERREGGPRSLDGVPGGVLGIPLEPAMLAVVGDPKQSI